MELIHGLQKSMFLQRRICLSMLWLPQSHVLLQMLECNLAVNSAARLVNSQSWRLAAVKCLANRFLLAASARCNMDSGLGTGFWLSLLQGAPRGRGQP